MMGEYAAFLLILVLGFACGYGTARARGIKQQDAVEAKTAVDAQADDSKPTVREITMKTMRENGMTEDDVIRVMAEQDARQEARRRDDNRAQRAPEEPWQ